MKRYELLRDLPTFHKGDIFELRDDGCLYLDHTEFANGHWKQEVMAYHRNTLAQFPNILADWFAFLEEDEEDQDDNPEYNTWWPFIQTTGELYDEDSDGSYECFEYGYLRQSGGMVLERRVIGKRADSFIAETWKFPPDADLAFDIVENEHIRIFSYSTPLKWKIEDTPLSTAVLVPGEPNVRKVQNETKK